MIAYYAVALAVAGAFIIASWKLSERKRKRMLIPVKVRHGKRRE